MHLTRSEKSKRAANPGMTNAISRPVPCAILQRKEQRDGEGDSRIKDASEQRDVSTVGMPDDPDVGSSGEHPECGDGVAFTCSEPGEVALTINADDGRGCVREALLTVTCTEAPEAAPPDDYASPLLLARH